MQPMFRKLGVASVVVVFAGLTAAAVAQPQGPGEREGRRGAPPPEFTEACVGKAEGDVVKLTLKGRDGESREVEAKCQLHDGVLSARPERTQGRTPPPQQS